MLLQVTHLQKSYVVHKSPISLVDLTEYISNVEGIEDDSLYFTYNGKLVTKSDSISDGTIYAIPRLVGGKGGFGSMLRAIGAQIEKTTNREACRDLSGRRLRDINEEKRLKNWIAQQADREREAAEKRKKKLERLCAEPKHEFEDKEYDKQRSELLDKVWDAVDQGMKASTSGCSSSNGSSKRKLPEPTTKAKKSCLWVDDIEELSSSADSEESEEESEPPKTKVKEEADNDQIIFSEKNKKECKKENGVSSDTNDEEQSKDSSSDHVKQVATG